MKYNVWQRMYMTYMAFEMFLESIACVEKLENSVVMKLFIKSTEICRTNEAPLAR